MATTSVANGGRSKKDADTGADTDADTGADADADANGDDGGVFVAIGVLFETDEIVDNELSDNCGELVAPVPLYRK